MKQIDNTIYFKTWIYFNTLANYDLNSLVDNKDLKPTDLLTNNFKKEIVKRRIQYTFVLMLFLFIITGLVLLIIGVANETQHLNNDLKFVTIWPKFYQTLFKAGWILMVSSGAITLVIISLSYPIYHFKLKKIMPKLKNLQDIGYLKKDQNVYPYILQWSIKVFFKKDIDRWNNAQQAFEVNKLALRFETRYLLGDEVSDYTFKKHPGFYGSSYGAYLGICVLFDKINGLNFAYKSKKLKI